MDIPLEGYKRIQDTVHREFPAYLENRYLNAPENAYYKSMAEFLELEVDEGNIGDINKVWDKIIK